MKKIGYRGEDVTGSVIDQKMLSIINNILIEKLLIRSIEKRVGLSMIDS